MDVLQTYNKNDGVHVLYAVCCVMCAVWCSVAGSMTGSVIDSVGLRIFCVFFRGFVGVLVFLSLARILSFSLTLS